MLESILTGLASPLPWKPSCAAANARPEPACDCSPTSVPGCAGWATHPLPPTLVGTRERLYACSFEKLLIKLSTVGQSSFSKKEKRKKLALNITNPPVLQKPVYHRSLLQRAVCFLQRTDPSSAWGWVRMEGRELTGLPLRRPCCMTQRARVSSLPW